MGMMTNRGKRPSESAVVMTELVLPNDANPLGNILGGKVMHLMDIAGAIAASRHCNRPVVTVYVDGISFQEPIKVGEVVVLEATVTWTGNTSMEVMIKVYGEDLTSGTRRHTNTAYFTFVALDDEGKPTRVPPIIVESDEEIRQFKEATIRREERLRRRARAKSNHGNGTGRRFGA
ncbi:MAG: acyl-CoA thioesterase [Firmicutes bacterium]|nr:acyl-CoA thioesterase [Bacillota bacterium]